MKQSQPTFRTEKQGNRTKLILQCSQCRKDIKELKNTDIINVQKGYYCKGCDDGAVHLNMPVVEN